MKYSVSCWVIALEVLVDVFDEFWLVGVEDPDVLVQLLEFLGDLLVGVVIVVEIFEGCVDFVKLVTQTIFLFLVGEVGCGVGVVTATKSIRKDKIYELASCLTKTTRSFEPFQDSQRLLLCFIHKECLSHHDNHDGDDEDAPNNNKEYDEPTKLRHRKEISKPYRSHRNHREPQSITIQI